MITRKNRREPILILQSASDMTKKIVKEIEKRDTLFGISFSFWQVQNWILWPKCEISRENIYFVKTLLYNKTV